MDKKDNKKKAIHEFDPEGLERAAKALREIKNNPHGKQALDLAKQQEKTKKEEMVAAQAEARAKEAEFGIQREKIRWEEQRKTIEYQGQQQQSLADYNDKLAKQRQEAEHEAQRRRNQELVKMQEESAVRQEQQRRKVEQEIQEERRQTNREKAALERETVRAKAKAEADGRIKQERENEDVNTRQMRVKAEEDRLKAKEVINTSFSNIGEGFNSLLADKTKMTRFVLAVTLVSGGIYATREAAKVAARQVERHLVKPPLVRETSRKSGVFALRNQITRMFNKPKKNPFDEVVLKEDLHQRVERLALATKNTKKNNAPFRHMLFYGPPGTGKTMVAKRLATTSGLDFAIMSGGDVGPLGADAVTEIHKVLDWAQTSRRGLMLFIDEAEGFLGSRGSGHMSENLRNALNAVLYRTGEQSKDLMLVLASNRPGDLDRAITDRVDEAIEFPLPDEAERLHLVKLYYGRYLKGEVDEYESKKKKGLQIFSSQARPIDTSEVTDEMLAEVAKKTEHFSGREISKLMVSIQGAVYGTHDAKLTAEIFNSVVEWKLEEHSFKDNMFTGRNYA